MSIAEMNGAGATQNALIARKLGDTPIGLFATRDYFERRGRIASKEDLRHHDLIGLDRGEFLIRAFAAYGIGLMREEFALRTDDGMLGWNLLLAGAGVGVGRTRSARRCGASFGRRSHRSSGTSKGKRDDDDPLGGVENVSGTT